MMTARTKWKLQESWLKANLSGDGLPAKEVFKLATLSGISMWRLRALASRIGVRHVRVDAGGGKGWWLWRLPIISDTKAGQGLGGISDTSGTVSTEGDHF
jgi:hypothetical protein